MRIPGSEFPGILKTTSQGTGGSRGPVASAPGTPRTAARPVLDSAPDIHSGSPKGGGRIPAALSSFLSQLKLPVDGLSVSIVSFAKFFSLPLNPDLLAKIRRQSASGPSGPGLPGGPSAENADPATREARSLACIAALGKGVELSVESLDRYARMISGRPLFPEPPNAGGRGADRGENHSNDGSPANPGTGQGSEGKGERNPGGGKKQSGNPEALRNLARKVEAGEPLLELLNRIPGKDGKRWLVIPVPLEDGGAGLQVTLRFLLFPRTGDVEQMTLEINGEKRRWLFNCRPGEVLQAALWPETGEGERARLEQELAGCLGLPPGGIKITGWNPVFVPDCRNDLFSLREGGIV